MDEKRLVKQLHKCLPDFVNQVDPEQLLPYLSCLSPASKEEIKARQNNKGKIIAAQDLCSHVIRYRERGVGELVAALRHEDIHQEELANLIDPPSATENTVVGSSASLQNDKFSYTIATGHLLLIFQSPYGKMNSHHTVRLFSIEKRVRYAIATVTPIEKKSVQRDIPRGPVDDEQQNIKKTYDRDTPLRRLPISVYRALRLLDSNDQIKNWETLAGEIGEYTVEDVPRFRQNPHEGSPTISMYNDWMTREGSTLGRLMQILTEMGRVDVCTELTKITGYQHPEDNGMQNGGKNHPHEVLYERLPEPVNPVKNVGPIPLRPREGQGNRMEKKEPDLPGPKQHIGRGGHGPGEDNGMQNGGKNHPHEVLYERLPEPVNPVKNVGPIPPGPRQGKGNRIEKKETDLPCPEQHIGRGGNGPGEGIHKNANNLVNKDKVKGNSLANTEKTSKVHSHEKEIKEVVCSAVKTNLGIVIVDALDDHECKAEEQDHEDPNTSTESEESNSRVNSSPSDQTLQADPRNNFKEFHKEKCLNKDVLTSEIRKEEENQINKAEQQDDKGGVGHQDQKVDVETQYYEKVPSLKDVSGVIISEGNTVTDHQAINKTKRYDDKPPGEREYVLVPTVTASMETSKPMTSTLEFQVCQKGTFLPDEQEVKREQFIDDVINQMNGGQNGKQNPKAMLNEKAAGVKEVQKTSGLLPDTQRIRLDMDEEHQGFGSLGFVPMIIDERATSVKRSQQGNTLAQVDKAIAYQGNTFAHGEDTVAHHDKAPSLQNDDVSRNDAEEENTYAQQDIANTELVDIPTSQNATNVQRDKGFQAKDDIQVLQSSSVQGGNSTKQQDDISGCIRSSAQRGRSFNVNHGWYFIIGLGIIIGACFIVKSVRKRS